MICSIQETRRAHRRNLGSAWAGVALSRVSVSNESSEERRTITQNLNNPPNQCVGLIRSPACVSRPQSERFSNASARRLPLPIGKTSKGFRHTQQEATHGSAPIRFVLNLVAWP